MSEDFDIAIIGSGFAGSLLAMIARRLGRTVVLLERGRHPRFAIGESSTPLTNLLLEELAIRYDLPRVRPLAKWGTWQQTHPQIACGLKRGFTFFHHSFGQEFRRAPGRENELLVAASPHDGIADTHWYRPDFDHFLVREAQAAGAEYRDEFAVEAVDFSPRDAAITGRRCGNLGRVTSRFVIDASGPRGCLHRALQRPEGAFANLPPTQGLYSHFAGVRRWEELFPSEPTPPYPVDEAALHHVFPGGWIWVLRFNNGLTSAGAAVTENLARELDLHEGAPAWERLLARLPGVRAQFAGARATLPFVFAPRLSFLSDQVAGGRWALLPSAAGFVDPLLSTGFPLTLLGIERLAEMIGENWEQPEWAARLEDYARQTTEELGTVARLVTALYARMDDFESFAALSLLYFAAASFTETARRLNRPALAGKSFLLGAHPRFGPAFHHCLDVASQPAGVRNRQELMHAVLAAIAPVDVAGLADRSRRNWHPVNASDLLAAAGKLRASAPEIEALLSRCGF